MPIDNRFIALKSYKDVKSVDNVNKLLIAFDTDISRMCNSAYYKYDLYSYTDGVAGVKSKDSLCFLFTVSGMNSSEVSSFKVIIGKASARESSISG